MIAGEFTFRPLRHEDVPRLWEWLNRPHVREWWTTPGSLEAAREEYVPAATYGAARPFLAWMDAAPVGYIQYYVVAEGGADWWPSDPGPGVVGIDQFLGRRSARGSAGSARSGSPGGAPLDDSDRVTALAT